MLEVASRNELLSTVDVAVVRDGLDVKGTELKVATADKNVVAAVLVDFDPRYFSK
jgi:hypothetical protein